MTDVLAGFAGDMAARWYELGCSRSGRSFYKCGSGCGVHSDDIDKYACNFRNILSFHDLQKFAPAGKVGQIPGRNLAKLTAQEKRAELRARQITPTGQESQLCHELRGVQSPSIVSSAANIATGEARTEETASHAMRAVARSQRALGARCARTSI